MIDQEDNAILIKIVFDDNNQDKKSWSFRDKPVPDFYLCF